MTIHWAGQEYTVKLTKEAIGGEDGPRSFIGRSNEATNVIVVDGTLPKTRQEEVFLHELIHTIDQMMPEHIVNGLGRNLYGILRENDLLRRNLMDRVSDGFVTKAEADALNKDSQEMAETPMMLIAGRETEEKFQARTDIQTLVMSKDTFPTKARASAWVREHEFKVKSGAPDETGGSWRYRQREPSEFRAGSFRTITLTDGVKAVIGRPK